MIRIKRVFALTGVSVAFADILLMLAGAGAYAYIIPAAAAGLVLCALFFRKYLFAALTVFLSVILACGTFCSLYFGKYVPQTAFDGLEAAVSGTAADFSGGSVTLENCEINSVSTHYPVTVYLSEDNGISPGDLVTVGKTQLRAKRDEGNVFFYHSLSSGTVLSCSAYYTDISVAHAEKSTPLSFIKRIRRNAENKLSLNLSAPSAATASALVTGNRDYMSDEAVSDLRTAGISHIFAVSGMHLAIWTAVIFFLFQRGSRSKKLPLAAAILFVLFYCAFTGFSPSVLRSAIMLIAVFAGALIKRKADALNSLGIAVTVLLIANPCLAGNVSFLLSAAATFAIIFVFPELSAAHKKHKSLTARKAGRITDSAVLSFTVIMLTLPLTAVFFGCVSLLTPITSLVCTPLAEGIMLTAGAGLLLLAKICAAPFKLCEILCRVMASVTAFFAKADFAVCPLDKKIILPWFALSAAAFTVVYLLKKDRKQRLGIVCLSSSLLLVTVALFTCFTEKNTAELFFPQAGGSSIFVVADKNSGSALIVGAGGDYSSSAAVSSYLSHGCINRNVACVIPREYKSENGAEKYISALCSEDGIIRSTAAKISFGDGNSFVYGENGSPCGIMTLNGVSIFVCLSPHNVPADYCPSADIFICRSYIPEGIDPAGYGKIIVMSEKSADSLCLPENAVSTGDGEILLTLSP